MRTSLLLAALVFLAAPHARGYFYEKKDEKRWNKDVEAAVPELADERKQAGKLKRPLNELVETALEKCEGDKTDALDEFLMRLPLTEIGFDEDDAKTYEAAAIKARFGDSAKIAATAERTYRQMRSGSGGATHGQALANASQQAGIAAYGDTIKNWDWTEYNRRRARKQEKEWAKETRRMSVAFVCLYRQARMNLLSCVTPTFLGSTYDKLLAARAMGRAFTVPNEYNCTRPTADVMKLWEEGLWRHTGFSSLAEADKLRILTEAMAFVDGKSLDALSGGWTAKTGKEWGRQLIVAAGAFAATLKDGKAAKRALDLIRPQAEKFDFAGMNCRSDVPLNEDRAEQACRDLQARLGLKAP